ncbi:MAG: outer membrane beta-barrel protein [Legionellaceae bacterium]|nr:outer membrane beta-barrel protein [Legionellaceae bacterium]
MHRTIITIFSLLLMLLFQIQAYALQPVQGPYAGVFLGPSTTNSNNFDFGSDLVFTGQNVTVSASSGKITHSVLGGVGGQIGYRFCTKYRIEGELYYNNNPIRQLQLNNFTTTGINSQYSTDAFKTNTTQIFNSNANTSDAYIQGDTNTGALMFNFIYDFFTANNDGYSKVVPFIGAGIGYAYVQNAMQVYRATTVDPANDPISNREVFDVLQSRWIYAGQLLIGVNYFLDDFTWFAIDVRYFTTGSSIARSRYTYTSPTTTETVSSNSSLFSNKTQIVSANISFSGAFDLG